MPNNNILTKQFLLKVLQYIDKDDVSYSQKANIVFDIFSELNPQLTILDKLGYTIPQMVTDIKQKYQAL